MGHSQTTWSEVREREGNNGYIRAGRGGGLLDNVDPGRMGGGGGREGEEVMMLRRENEMLRWVLIHYWSTIMTRRRSF